MLNSETWVCEENDTTGLESWLLKVCSLLYSQVSSEMKICLSAFQKARPECWWSWWWGGFVKCVECWVWLSLWKILLLFITSQRYWLQHWNSLGRPRLYCWVFAKEDDAHLYLQRQLLQPQAFPGLFPCCVTCTGYPGVSLFLPEDN